MNNPSFNDFKKTVWNYYAQHGRLFDWRHADDPYKIFISEVMLQQTQTVRVAQKYPHFIATFASFEALANATLKEVLTQWQGLGYNRRGKFLHEAAQEIVKNYSGQLPDDPSKLVQLPGIGKATAASICAFAFNRPTIFIETNIRTVYIHFFFSDKTDVHDNDIVPLLEATLDVERARDWYYALMDYGVMLKKTLINPSRKSAHHTKQTKFEGSDRQVRGMILKLLTSSKNPISYQQLLTAIEKDEDRVKRILEQLIAEKFIILTDQRLEII